MNRMKPFFIGIAGGSGSGKSTFTNRLKQYFPDQVTVVYHDDYYRCQDEKSMDERRRVNYDHPDSLETDLLVRHLDDLSEGKAVHGPIYDYSQHNRSKETRLLYPYPIIIVEGILLFHSIELCNRLDLKIFVDADADERILRRVRRDVMERGREVEDIMRQYLETVKPMHSRYVEPTKAKADLVINSGMNEMSFEVVKSYIEKLLSAGYN